ncbi:hypothetical protein K450DRAFT_225563 [Umbelopsis ramanniana AG]|uniref:Uncharacterized protein n=1 Tax=Umbelopsis ramanniana AG TaxID=1314678 RepID=A0AAD5EGE8_UMBRA|nr:uncharacterized protein K450DRAFT_225563 [Umbelopsis ramanniana AG]KAI8582937.1 hypothetical protein K450DRAFT_225563 [Umbelopsis ramanniana AG]
MCGVTSIVDKGNEWKVIGGAMPVHCLRSVFDVSAVCNIQRHREKLSVCLRWRLLLAFPFVECALNSRSILRFSHTRYNRVTSLGHVQCHVPADA